MQITVNRADLASAVTWAMQGVSKRPVVPVLAGMRATVEGGRLTLAAFDYEVTARAHVSSEGSEPGTIMVTGQQLRDAVRSLPKGRTAGAVTITGDEAALTLACDGITARVPVPGWDLAEYPSLPEMPALAGTIDGATFARTVARVAAAAGTDATLPVLTCVSVGMSDRLEMTATDRYRLATDSADWTPADVNAAGQEMRVPAKVLAAFAKATAGAGKVAICATINEERGLQRGITHVSGKAGFATDERELIVSIDGGQFPRVRHLMPSASETTVTTDAAALLAAVKRAGMTSGRNEAVRLHANGALNLETRSDGQVVGSEDVPAERDGPEITMGFNPAYLASLIAGVTGTVRLGFTSKKPCLVTPAADGDAFRALVMPISLDA